MILARPQDFSERQGELDQVLPHVFSSPFTLFVSGIYRVSLSLIYSVSLSVIIKQCCSQDEPIIWEKWIHINYVKDLEGYRSECVKKCEHFLPSLLVVKQ